MDASFIPIEVVPSKTPFGLDQLRRSYKTSLSAADAIAACPAVGTADETFEFMFLMPINTPESAESATRIDLVYHGCIADDGEGNPLLPDQKHDNDNSVLSSSSSKPKTGVALTSPITIQYYAPSSTLTYFSYGAPGTDDAEDPADVPVVIGYTVGDTSYAPSTGILEIVTNFFSPFRTVTKSATEIVPGKFWTNTSRVTKTLIPWIFDFEPGAYAFLASQSLGYAVGDVITISAGGESATVEIDAPIFDYGYIANYHQLTNTFTTSHSLLAGSPPTHGPPNYTALWNIVIIE